MEIAAASRPATNGADTPLELLVVDTAPEAGDTDAKPADVDEVVVVQTMGVDTTVVVDVVGESPGSPGSRTVYLRDLNFVRTISCGSEHENTAHESVYDYI